MLALGSRITQEILDEDAGESSCPRHDPGVRVEVEDTSYALCDLNQALPVREVRPQHETVGATG